MRLPTTAVILTSLACSLAAPSLHAAAAKTDFSGSYTVTGSKGAFKAKGSSWSIRVVQTETTIEISKTIEGKENLNTFQLDGSEGVYTSSGGQRGIGKAQLKGKMLILETFIKAQPQPNAPAVQIHTRERWELSLDSKTLTIRSDVDFPNSGVGGFQVIEPWAEIYKRN
jgi:hypothetical protein